MKKIISLLTLLSLITCGSLFAQESSEKEVGASFGASLSILGFTPEVSLIYNSLEVGVNFPILSGTDYETDEKLYGFAFGAFVGFIDKPWTSGYQNAFGISYNLLPKDYIHASIFGEDLDDDFNTDDGAHLLAFYYRGTGKFNENVGLYFKVALPLYAGFSGTDSISIIDSSTSWACWLLGLGSASIGFRVEI